MEFLSHNSIPYEASFQLKPTANNTVRDVQTVRFAPRSANAFTYEGSNVIKFDIASNPDYFMKGKNSYLTFEHYVAGMPLTDAPAANPVVVGDVAIFNTAHDWIKRIRITNQRGDVLEDIDNYNLLYSILTDATVGNDFRQSMSGSAIGYNDETSPAAKLANGKENSVPNNIKYKTYNIALNSGILRNDKYLATGFLPLILEIYLDKPKNCHLVVAGALNAGALVPKDAPGLEYTIRNAYYVAEMAIMDDQYVKNYTSAILNNGVKLTYHTHTYSSTDISGNVVNFRIGENIKNIKTVLAIMRTVAEQNKSEFNSFVYKDVGIEEYQFSSGSSLYPIQPIKCDSGKNTVEAYSELLKAFRYFNDMNHTSLLTLSNYSRGDNASTKFIIAQEFERDSMTSFGSALKTLDHRLQLYIKFNTLNPAVPAGTMVVESFTHYDKMITMRPGGQIEDHFR